MGQNHKLKFNIPERSESSTDQQVSKPFEPKNVKRQNSTKNDSDHEMGKPIGLDRMQKHFGNLAPFQHH
jgi:hypothetical protein